MTVKQIDGYKIRMNDCLGTGAYGSVYVGESDKTHKKVAIKVIQKNASTSFLIQSTPTSTSRTLSSNKSRSWNPSTTPTSSSSSMSWKAQKIITLSRKCAMAISPKSCPPKNKSIKKLRLTCWRKSAMVSWPWSEKVSFIEIWNPPISWSRITYWRLVILGLRRRSRIMCRSSRWLALRFTCHCKS